MSKNVFFIVLMIFILSDVKAQDFNASRDCNINAQDGGTDYARAYRTMPREATVKVRIDGLCTGTLLNQKTSDGQLRFYLLTARHCTIGVNFNIEHTLYFNYPFGVVSRLLRSGKQSLIA